MATETRTDQQTETNGSTPNTYEQLLELGRDSGYKLDWMITREALGDSIEVDAERGGLLLQEIDRNEAAETSDWSNNMTGRPRGAIERPSAPRIGNYSIRTKSDVWLKNGAQLYANYLRQVVRDV